MNKINGSFSPEKPTLINEGAPTLLRLNNDENWVGQIKLDEHRSFIHVGPEGCEVEGWRGNMFVADFPLRSNVPMVLDGGLLKQWEFIKRPVLYIFDVLLINGERVSLRYRDRYSHLIKHIDECHQVIIARNFQDFLTEYDSSKRVISDEIQRMANLTGYKAELYQEINEGMVIKNLNSMLSYPRGVTKCAWQLKLKYKGA